jgi:hypothetical protein
MTNENSKVARRMLALIDSQAKFIAESSDEEFLDFVKEKELLSKLENSARESLDVALRASKKRRLFAAKDGLRKAQAELVRSERIPSSADDRRSLFERLLGRDDLPGDLTLAFRERKGQLSDAEIESALEDLDMLGFFEGDSDGQEDEG